MEKEQNSKSEEKKNKKSEPLEDSSKEKEIKLTPEEKINDLEDKLTRALAEMENQRRRFEKEKEDAFEYGGFSFARESLNLIDNFDRAKQSLENDIDRETATQSQVGKWRFSRNLDVFDNAHAILVLTEWEEYKYIQWQKVVKKMVKPSWVFDSRSIINAKEIKEAGINLWRLGDGSQNNEIRNF